MAHIIRSVRPVRWLYSLALGFAGCTIVSAPPPDYVPFGFNADEPAEEHAPIITEAAGHLRADPELHVLVVGHTDSVGSEEYNAELSLRRASEVRNRLIADGIAEHRIRWAARGEGEPRSEGDSADSRALNRRVELFYFYPNEGPVERQYGFTLRFGS
ncbi:MAG: OmpA family protein [Myxococcota bacterium]